MDGDFGALLLARAGDGIHQQHDALGVVGLDLFLVHGEALRLQNVDGVGLGHAHDVGQHLAAP